MAAQNRQKIVVRITFMLCAKFYLRGDHIVSHAKFPGRYVIRRANDRGGEGHGLRGKCTISIKALFHCRFGGENLAHSWPQIPSLSLNDWDIVYFAQIFRS